MADSEHGALEEYVPARIWLVEYPIRYGGMDLYSRMTIIRLNSGQLFVHSPCRIDSGLKAQIDALGPVAFIVAPGSFHHLYVSDFQQCYPDAETFVCPGVEKKRPELSFDALLGDRPDPRWKDELDQVFVTGTKIITEVAFLHRESRTLILTDLLENIGDDYQHEADLVLRFWWKLVFHMWNNPKPAPEYQIGWGDKAKVRKALQKIVDWDAQRIVLAHGELIEGHVRAVLGKAWEKVLADRSLS